MPMTKRSTITRTGAPFTLMICGLLAMPFASSVALAQDDLKISVMGWETSGGFFSAMEKGVKDAGRDLGVDVEYVYPTDATIPGYTKRLQLLIGTEPDALVVGDFFPDAADPLLVPVVEKGIPVVILNRMQKEGDPVAALAFIGLDDRLAGEAAGKAMAAAGVKNGLYVNQCAANPACIVRGEGFAATMEAAGSKATILNLSLDEAANPTAMVQAIRGGLASDPSIDGVLTYAPQVQPLKQAIEQSGRAGIKVGLIDLSDAALQAVVDGLALFVIDQQPYLQGYYGVLFAYQELKYGMHGVGDVLTGPLLITKDGAQKALDANNQGYRGDR